MFYHDRIRSTVYRVPLLLSVFIVLIASELQMFAAANSLAVSTPKAFQVVQRNSANVGDITVTGTYTGSPQAIEARWKGGTWITIDPTPSAGFFSGRLNNLTAGQGTLEVRFSNDFATTVAVANVGIGDIFVCAGQSNMSGRGTDNQTYSNPSFKATMLGNDYVWKELVDPSDSNTGQVDTVSRETTPPSGSMLPPLATQLLTRLQVPVAFIPAAKGGSSIIPWQPGADHYDRTTLYGSMAFRARAAGGVRAVLWWQGETDAQNSMAQSTYNAFLDTVANAVAADLGVKLIVCKLQTLSDPAVTDDPAAQGRISAAIAEAWADNPNVLPGPDLSAMTTEDGLHLKTTAKLIQAAGLWADAIMSGLGNEIPSNGLLNNMVAYYKCNESSSGQALLDASAGSRDLVANGATAVAGVDIGARRFTSGSSHRAVSTDPSFGFSGDFTVAFWWQCRMTGQDQCLIAKDDTQNSSSRGWGILQSAGTDTLSFYATPSGGAPTSVTFGNVALVNGGWYFICARRSGSVDAISVTPQGEATRRLAATAVVAAPLQVSSGPFMVACRTTGGTRNTFAQGDLDDLGVWNAALSDSQLDLLYGAGVPLRFSNFGGDADYDGDGLPNLVEVANGLNVSNAADALQDWDGDGINNLTEYRAETDMKNSRSRLGFDGIQVNGNTATLTMRVAAGVPTLLQVSPDFPNTAFQTLGSSFTPGGGLVSSSDVNAGADYRVYQTRVNAGGADVVPRSWAGLRRLPIRADSDTMVTLPFTRPAAEWAAVSSVSGNSVSIRGVPGWAPSQWVYSAGSQSNTYYMLISSGTREGSYYTITGNSGSGLVLDLAGDTLNGLVQGDIVAIVPYWTVGTIFAGGQGVIASSAAGAREMEVLVPDVGGAGTDLSAAKTYYFRNGAWRRVGGGFTSRNDDVILPDMWLWLRNNTEADTELVLQGTVVASSWEVPLQRDSQDPQDNFVALPRPNSVTLDSSGLIASGAFKASSSQTSRTDELFVFDGQASGKNKVASGLFYFWQSAWRELGFGGADVGDSVVLGGGNGVILRLDNSATAPALHNDAGY